MRDWGSDICTDRAEGHVHVHIIFHPDGTDSLDDGMFTTWPGGRNPQFCFPVKLYAFVSTSSHWKRGSEGGQNTTSLVLRTKYDGKEFMESGGHRRSREWTMLPSLTQRIWSPGQNEETLTIYGVFYLRLRQLCLFRRTSEELLAENYPLEISSLLWQVASWRIPIDLMVNNAVMLWKTLLIPVSPICDQ